MASSRRSTSGWATRSSRHTQTVPKAGTAASSASTGGETQPQSRPWLIFRLEDLGLRLRRLMNANIQGLLVAAGQNLKRFLIAAGWG